MGLHNWGAEHGTRSGLEAHRRRGDTPCASCRYGARRELALIRQEKDGVSPANWSDIMDPRPIRNGLPDFVPYRWRGVA